MDDFYDDLKTKGKHVWNTAKQFIADNKQKITPILKTIASWHPVTQKILDIGNTVFGGQLKSEDPYSVDIAFLKYIFGLGPARWCPRY